MPVTIKKVPFFVLNGQGAEELRKKLKMNQKDFWKKVGVTQSGGSRYESGRKMPKPILALLNIAYAPTPVKSASILLKLQNGDLFQ